MKARLVPPTIHFHALTFRDMPSAGGYLVPENFAADFAGRRRVQSISISGTFDDAKKP